MAGGRSYDATKFRELILYVASRSQSDPWFGKTKLNKILFFSDFSAFRTSGTSITGARYQHLPQGPCPTALLPAITELQDDHSVVQVPEPTYAGTQYRLVALRSADLSSFSGTEVAIVEKVLGELSSLTNSQVSLLSHDTMAWRLTTDGEEIPYGAAVLSSDPVSAEDLKWLAEVAASEGMAGTSN